MKSTQPPTPKQPLAQTQLLIRFAVPGTDNPDMAAELAAQQFAESQCWGTYEVRRAKEKKYQETRPDGSVWCRYEVFGRFDVEKLSAKVMERLEQRATEGAKS